MNVTHPLPRLLANTSAPSFRPVSPRSANLLRLTLIAFSLTLLVACGGGGGSSATATRTPPPVDNPDPMTPDLDPLTLPGYALDAATARTHVDGSTEPTAANTMNETAIVGEIQRIATAADTFEFSDFNGTASVTITCDNTDKSCTGTVPDVGVLTFSLADIEDLSLVDGDMGLMDFDSDTEAVMVDNGVTMIQSQSVARDSGGTQLSFQTYGGWLTDSVFGVTLLDVTENDTTTSRIASFSFGKATGSRPAGRDLVRWTGSMVGMNTDEDIFQGDASAEIDLADTNGRSITGIQFTNVVNIDTGNSVGTMSWTQIPIETDGTFGTNNGDIKGAFYGADHAEIGGTFNRNSIIGAFGAKK